MKVLLVVHGFPPELVGGTEDSVQREALELLAAGDDVCVFAGTFAEGGESELVEPTTGRRARVVRVARADLFADHWHKTLAPAVTRSFVRLVREFRPHVVHVHHWIRLSRDLVLAAARERVPAVVSLHDAWTTCPLAFRVETEHATACDAPVGPHPCLACAARIGPRTRWVKREQEFILLAERQSALARELALARCIFVPTLAHRGLLERHGALTRGDARVRVLAPRPAPTLAELGGGAGHERGGESGGAPGGPRGSPRRAPAEEGRLVLGVPGHLMPHKGQDLVLDACARLGGEVDVELRFAGADAEPNFAQRLRERADPARTRFFGGYTRTALASHPVSDVHAWVLASRARESYGLVLDEARALGLPCVVADHGALGERAREGGASRFVPGDAADLARALTELARANGPWAGLATRAAELGRGAQTAGAWRAALQSGLELARESAVPEVRAEEWFEARVAQAFLDAWDDGVRRGGPA
ncbi:MAG: glycosyltransferase [Planctomycetes bacterium]|nr:glycosyltransferase [Planctomycetota bacterium]